MNYKLKAALRCFNLYNSVGLNIPGLHTNSNCFLVDNTVNFQAEACKLVLKEGASIPSTTGYRQHRKLPKCTRKKTSPSHNNP